MTSHTKMLLSSPSPQLMPGMSLSFFICFSWRARSPAVAADILKPFCGCRGRQGSAVVRGDLGDAGAGLRSGTENVDVKDGTRPKTE